MNGLVSETAPPPLPKILSDVFLTREVYNKGFLYNNPELCPKKGYDLKLFLFVVSAPGNQNRRLAVRQTWGSFGHRRDTAIAFVLGETQNTTERNLLSKENVLYGDLIMGRNQDAYENLTLISINILEWSIRYCSKAKFIFKTDDDMFVNVRNLLEVVEEYRNTERTIIGHLAHKWSPERNLGKYGVSVSLYPNDTWPDFITGQAYLISRDLIAEMFESALQQVYIKLEDVFVTGLAARLLGIKLVNNDRFFDVLKPFKKCKISGKIVNLHQITPENQYLLWDTMQTGNEERCRMNLFSLAVYQRNSGLN